MFIKEVMLALKYKPGLKVLIKMKKRNLSKKELELVLLRNFLSNEALGLKVKSITESETPDFIIEELNKNISVELTRLIHPATMQKEAFQEKLVEMAQQFFKEKYDDELYVLVTFGNVSIKCKGEEIKKHAEDIFKVVEDIYLPNRKYEFNVSSKYSHHINSYIGHITVANNRDLENWQPFGAYKVNYVDIGCVKGIIKEKEKGLEQYSKRFKENWLLLIANFGHKSSTHGIYHLKQQKIETKFDKIYLYKYMDKEIVELK